MRLKNFFHDTCYELAFTWKSRSADGYLNTENIMSYV